MCYNTYSIALSVTEDILNKSVKLLTLAMTLAIISRVRYLITVFLVIYRV